MQLDSFVIFIGLYHLSSNVFLCLISKNKIVLTVKEGGSPVTGPGIEPTTQPVPISIPVFPCNINTVKQMFQRKVLKVSLGKSALSHHIYKPFTKVIWRYFTPDSI